MADSTRAERKGGQGREPEVALALPRDSAHHHLVTLVAEAAGGRFLHVGIAGVVLQLAVAGGHLSVQAVGEVMQDAHAVLHGLQSEQGHACEPPPSPQGAPRLATHLPDQSSIQRDEQMPAAPSVCKDLSRTPQGPDFESWLCHFLAI